MRNSIRIAGLRIFGTIIVALVMVSLAGCPPEPGPVETNLTFDDLTVGMTYNVGESIEIGGVGITVLPFVWTDTTVYSGGTLTVANTAYAVGGGLELWANNVNVGFDFRGTIGQIELNYADEGGNTNIEVNGQFYNQADLYGVNLAGVTENYSAITGNAVRLTIQGELIPTAFSVGGDGEFNLIIGGQEFAIDNVESTVD
jgi:hypothetical protein